MKVPVAALTAGSLFLAAATLCAQETGVSHPEALDDNITVSTPKPAAPAAVQRPSSSIATEPTPVLHTHPTTVAQASTPKIYGPGEADPIDAGIVVTRPYTENAISEGTMVKARLDSPLSTTDTHVGSRFAAHLTEDIDHAGRVIFPAGTILSGRVTEVRGGRRIGGAAAIHIEPEILTLPDGTTYRIAARVIDLDPAYHAKVTDEGTILGNQAGKGTAAALTLTTSSAAAAGAMIGGIPGAAIGAGIGAGAGAIWWLKQDTQQSIANGTQIVFSLTRPLELTPLAH